MLEAFFREQGIYYVIIMLCAIGVVGKCYESRIYSRLMVAVENPERTEHPFMKQLKLKYKNYYMLERKIYNTDAFIETNLFRYKHRFIRLEGLHTVNSRIMLLCIIVSCIGVAACVHYKMGTGKLMYHILAGALAVAGLELIEQQFGIDSRRRMLFVSLKDYLENGLANQLQNRSQEETESNLGKTALTDSKASQLESKNTKETKDLQKQAARQVAVTETIAEKVASELAQEKVIVEVIKEFFP